MVKPQTSLTTKLRMIIPSKQRQKTKIVGKTYGETSNITDNKIENDNTFQTETENKNSR